MTSIRRYNANSGQGWFKTGGIGWRITLGFLVAGASALHWSVAVAAEDNRVPMGDRFEFSIGAFFVQNANGTFQVDRTVAGSAVTVGANVNWERDLDGDDSMTVPRLDGFYRFNPYHRVDFSWYKIEREANTSTQRELVFNGVTYTAGTTVEGRWNTEIIKAAYTYSFYRAPEIEVALSAGLHITKNEMELKASGVGTESVEVTAPLPVFGFRFDYALSPKWMTRAKYELFAFNSSQGYSGSFVDFLLAIEHKTFKNVGFGFSFNRVTMDAEASEDNYRAQLHSILNGFTLYTTLRY